MSFPVNQVVACSVVEEYLEAGWVLHSGGNMEWGVAMLVLLVHKRGPTEPEEEFDGLGLAV